MHSINEQAASSLRVNRRLIVWSLAGGLVLALLFALPQMVFLADDPEPPKSIKSTCGTCPSGYAMTGKTTSPEICKEGDPTLVECAPIGSINLLSVCGSCPEGYVQIGSSNVPKRCGNADGGRLSQCQLQKLENVLPDPNRGGIFCPPNCAGQLPDPNRGGIFCPPNCAGQMPPPGQGAIPPPPR